MAGTWPSDTRGTGRFARVALAAVLDRRISAAALRVLACVASYTNRQNTCHPAVATIASRLGLTERMVQRHLRRLEACGYIETEANFRSWGAQGANVYTLLYPDSELRGRATPDATRTPSPEAALRGMAPDATGTRSFNKTKRNKSPGSEWNAVVLRMTTRHGFDALAAWTVVMKASQQAGGAERLDTLMAADEASGTSAHDKIMAAVAGAEAA